MTADSFIYDGPLDPYQQTSLYILRDEDDRARQALERVGSECVLVSLIGARQTGKTSLLYRLHRLCGESGGWVPVQLDLSTWHALHGEQWYQQIIVACCQGLLASVSISVSELIGARQTGKTSLLYRLHRLCGESGGWVPVQLDLSTWHALHGEQWYQQIIVACCQGLLASVSISVSELRQHCEQNFIASPFSAQGWTELVYLACQRLPSGRRLLLSLDGINRMPHEQWGPLFSNIRAIHQAARSPHNRREQYCKLGMTLSGAFVPAQLITDENSPFNVSKLVYMSPVSMERLAQVRALLGERGIIVEDGALTAIQRWSGGKPYYVQRLCAELAQISQTPVTAPMIDEIADAITSDDVYLGFAIKRLGEDATLTRYAKKILENPRQFNRTMEPIATLEIMGVIRQDVATKKWVVTNYFYEQALRQFFNQQEEQAMTGMEPILVVALTKAVDFLFDEAGKLMQERRENRQTRGKDDDMPTVQAGTAITTKEEIKGLEPKQTYLKDIPKEVKHCLDQIERYRSNKRLAEARINYAGGLMNSPIHLINDLEAQEDGIKDYSQRLKKLVEEVYGHKIIIVGL